jgi:hypothetical protein
MSFIKEATPASIVEAVTANGQPGTISCDCGADEVYLEGDVTVDEVEASVAALIDHARYAHLGPRSIIVTRRAEVVVDLGARS